MEKKQTAVEWYANASHELIVKKTKGEITNTDFLIMHHNLFYEAQKMEKGQIEKSYTLGREQWQKYEWDNSNYENDIEIPTPRKYYNETYGGQDE